MAEGTGHLEQSSLLHSVWPVRIFPAILFQPSWHWHQDEVLIFFDSKTSHLVQVYHRRNSLCFSGSTFYTNTLARELFWAVSRVISSVFWGFLCFTAHSSFVLVWWNLQGSCHLALWHCSVSNAIPILKPWKTDWCKQTTNPVKTYKKFGKCLVSCSLYGMSRLGWTVKHLLCVFLRKNGLAPVSFLTLCWRPGLQGVHHFVNFGHCYVWKQENVVKICESY